MKLFVGPWQQRKPAVVSLDLRWREHVHGVAVDLDGRLLQWHTQDRQGDDPMAALDLLRQLDPGDATVRLLLAEPAVQTTSIHGVQEPDVGQIQEALLGDGHAPLKDPMVACLPMGDAWLVSACDGRTAAPWLDGLASLGVTRIELVADTLLLAHRLQPGETSVEAVDDRLLLAARPMDGEPMVRSLAGPAEKAFQDLLQEVSALGTCQTMQVLGASRQSLAINLRAAGLTTAVEPLPWNDSGALAMPHEVAWLLATANDPPALRSTYFERIAQHLAWSRRLRRGAVVGGALGVLLMVATLAGGWWSRDTVQQHRLQKAELHQELEQVQALAVQVEDIQTLRTELQNQRVPWPPLAPLLAELATALPDGARLERLHVHEADLELEAWAPISQDEALFGRLRHQLSTLPRLSNLSWDPAAASPSRPGSVQLLSARIRRPSKAVDLGP